MDLADRRTQILRRYASGLQAGRAAITRRTHDTGTATYVSARLGPDGLLPVLGEVCAVAGLSSRLPEPVRSRVELVARVGDAGRFLFVINRGDEDVEVDGFEGLEPVAAPSLSSVADGDGRLRIGPRGVAVLRSPADPVTD